MNVSLSKNQGSKKKTDDVQTSLPCPIIESKISSIEQGIKEIRAFLQQLIEQASESEEEDSETPTPVPVFQEKGRSSSEVRHGQHGNDNSKAVGPASGSAGYTAAGLHPGSNDRPSRFSNLQQHRLDGNTSSVHTGGHGSSASSPTPLWCAGHLSSGERGLSDQVMESKVDVPQQQQCPK